MIKLNTNSPHCQKLQEEKQLEVEVCHFVSYAFQIPKVSNTYIHKEKEMINNRIQ